MARNSGPGGARDTLYAFLKNPALRHYLRPRSFGRFAVTGVVNTIVGIGIFPALYWLMGRFTSVNALLILSWLISTGFAFVSHKLVTFKSGGRYHSEGLKFLLLSLTTLGVNLLVMNAAMLVSAAHPVIVQVAFSSCVGLTMMVLNYLGMDRFIFKSSGPPAKRR